MLTPLGSIIMLTDKHEFDIILANHVDLLMLIDIILANYVDLLILITIIIANYVN